MPTILDDPEKTFPPSEWDRLEDLDRQFGIKRSTAYNLIREGLIKSAAVRRRGARTGVWLIDFESVREFFRMQSKSARKQNAPCSMPRKTSLNRALQTKLCALLAGGNPVTTASGAVGVSDRTFHEWMERGEREGAGQFRGLFLSVSRARARAKERLVRRVTNAAAQDWRAAAWMLERHYPKEYGPTAQRQAEATEHSRECPPMRIILDTGGKTMEELLDFLMANGTRAIGEGEDAQI